LHEKSHDGRQVFIRDTGKTFLDCLALLLGGQKQFEYSRISGRSLRGGDFRQSQDFLERAFFTERVTKLPELSIQGDEVVV
jgi:hypothetical protein